jgi:hypothetical protein
MSWISSIPWSDVLVNVFSDFVYTLCAFFIVFLFWLVFQVSKWKKLLRFFGLKKNRPRLRVYLSNLYVLAGGAKDFRGERRRYEGSAVSEPELGVIDQLSRLLAHSILDQLGIVREWLGERYWIFRKPELVFQLSPLDPDEIQFDSIISVGSSGYNSVTDYYQNEYNPTMILDHEAANDPNRCIVINYGERRGQFIPIAPGRDMGVLAKVYDCHHDTVVFIGAGFNVNGSLGAIRYLIDHWQELAKSYQDVVSWAVCLDFPHPNYDAQGYLRPTVVTRVPEPEKRRSFLDRLLGR